MTRWLLLLVPGAVLAAVLLGAALPASAAVTVATLLGVAVAVLLWRAQAARVGGAARRINRWLDGPFEPLRLGGGRHWDELAVAVNALGASYERREERLSREAPWRSHVVGSIESPALLFSAEERLLSANDAARELLGVSAGDPGSTLIQALGSAAFAGAAREARALRRPIQVDAEMGERDLRATASAIGDETLVILTDRTDQRRVEELRRNFVVNASHELKTPATAISTLAEALEVAIASGSERTPQLVARLREESERLVRMVHDLLDLRRLEERGPMDRVPVDLAALVRAVAAEHQPRAAEVGIELEVSVPEHAYAAGVTGDLRLVVDNLVANAIQYNEPGGGVAVGLTRDGGDYVLTVRDTGVGIPQADLQRVFERFYRVDVGRSRERGGTGLGLSIVRHAVERHGGTVRAQSLLGEGSVFTVRLPVEPGA